jgi:hypothetical protein
MHGSIARFFDRKISQEKERYCIEDLTRKWPSSCASSQGDAHGLSSLCSPHVFERLVLDEDFSTEDLVRLRGNMFFDGMTVKKELRFEARRDFACQLCLNH